MMTAHSLLMGQPPSVSILNSFRSILHFSCLKEMKGDTKVSPSALNDGSLDISNSAGVDTAVEKQKSFCGSILTIMSLSECSSILITTCFWSILNINPLSPGSEPIPLSQSVKNLIVMLIGELIITDSATAYLGRKVSFYCIDPGHQWDLFMNNRRIFRIGVLCMISLAVLPPITNIPTIFCYTSWKGSESEIDDFVLTMCPAPPNITDMSVVGKSYV